MPMISPALAYRTLTALEAEGQLDNTVNYSYFKRSDGKLTNTIFLDLSREVMNTLTQKGIAMRVLADSNVLYFTNADVHTSLDLTYLANSEVGYESRNSQKLFLLKPQHLESEVFMENYMDNEHIYFDIGTLRKQAEQYRDNGISL